MVAKGESARNKKLPLPCLCIESLLCPVFSLSSSRVYLMRSFQIASDPMDRRLIRFNNTLQMLACLCNVIGLPGSDIIDCIADLVTATMMGCISAQLSVETKLLESQGFKAPGAPEEIEMKR